ncbi:MAG: hypothetical protein LKG56_02840 [Lachnospiraceae bacterium]|jgi:hypothetical protein|nr:hypothetical protein [Lachnospiraceae bacterium]MCH4030620.1 hypothetical protein [Lachnospiraceae bacterium]MCH4069829.1 hypothetical protein [Lachnospiraceae bacterium]MCH4107232.1 hypothetical protein [Lachnospiraceae bacterium]MCI1301913.1 hypothetical protein [Lachnospiraceae bacterium]
MFLAKIFIGNKQKEISGDPAALSEIKKSPEIKKKKFPVTAGRLIRIKSHRESPAFIIPMMRRPGEG